MRLLVTGAAGFIGFHPSRLLPERGNDVVGLDNLNAYYDPALKSARLDILKSFPQFRFVKAALADRDAMEQVFSEADLTAWCTWAQAGVRYSPENPHAYVQSNVVGFRNVLEGCRHHAIEHLVYASTSSTARHIVAVYKVSGKLPGPQSAAESDACATGGSG